MDICQLQVNHTILIQLHTVMSQHNPSSTPYPLPDASLIVHPPAPTVNTLQLPPHNNTLTLWQQCQQLSLQNKIFCTLIPLMFISMSNQSTTCSALVIIFLLPAMIILYRYSYSINYKYIELEILTRLYSIGFTTGSLVVLLIETLFTALFAIVCFNNQLQRYMAEWSDILSGNDTSNKHGSLDPTTDDTIPHNINYYIFILLLCYISAGCVEEGLKYWAINRVKLYRPNIQSESAILYYSAAIALGFSTIENIGYLFTTCAEADYTWEIVLSAVERVCISTPLHLMTSYLIGIGVIRRDIQNEPLKLYQIMLLPIIYHGTFDYGLMCISSVNESLGDTWSLLLTLTFVLIVELSLAFTIRYQNKKYQINDSSKVGFNLVESNSNDIESQSPHYIPQYMSPAAYELYYNSLNPQQQQALLHAQNQLQSYQQQQPVVVPIQDV